MRAGDSFQIEIQGTARAHRHHHHRSRARPIDSLATKINAQLGGIGKAAVNYTGGAEGLKIQVNPGNTINLVAGPADFDALARLGITAGRADRARHGQHQPASPAARTSSKVTPTYGLGLTAASPARWTFPPRPAPTWRARTLLAVLSNIQSTYQKTNAPPPRPQQPGNTSGTAIASHHGAAGQLQSGAVDC